MLRRNNPCDTKTEVKTIPRLTIKQSELVTCGIYVTSLPACLRRPRHRIPPREEYCRRQPRQQARNIKKFGNTIKTVDLHSLGHGGLPNQLLTGHDRRRQPQDILIVCPNFPAGAKRLSTAGENLFKRMCLLMPFHIGRNHWCLCFREIDRKLCVDVFL